MHLNDVLVACQCLHHLRLQLSPSVFSGSNGINAYGHDNAMLLCHLHGYLAGEPMYLMSRHRVIDIDVERADLHIRPVVVENQVVHPMHALELGHLLLDLIGEFGRDTGAQQFVDRRGQHFDTGLDDDNGDKGAQDTVEADIPQQHDTSRNEGGQRNNGIEKRIRARGNQGIAVQLLPLLLDISPQNQLHYDGHHDDHERRRGVFRFGRVENLLHRLDE